MNCATHTREPVVGTCARCGNFVCRLDSRPVKAELHCTACAGRTTNHLAALRDELWGKRDGWAWLIGLGSIYSVFVLVTLVALIAARQGSVPPALYGLTGLVGLSALNSIGYFFGVKATRVGIILLPLLSLGLNSALGVPGSESVVAVFGALIGVAIYNDSRNKLFFKIELTDAQLEKLWNNLKNNAIARTGFACSILGLMLPGLSVISLVCSIVGLSKVDPHATPPIGKKGFAIAGIIISILGIGLWVTVFLASKR